MASLMRLQLDPPPRKLRTFGIAFALVLGVVGAVLVRRDVAMPWAAVPWAAGGLAFAVAFLHPPALRWPFVALSVATFPIGFVVSHALLLAFYFLLLTPLGLVARLTGRDRLALRRDPSRASYWEPRPPRPGVPRYFRQF
jgi:hypothetical protein